MERDRVGDSALAALRYWHLVKCRNKLSIVKRDIGEARWAAVRQASPQLLQDNFGGEMWGGGRPTSIGWDSIQAARPGAAGGLPEFPPWRSRPPAYP